MMVEQKIRVQGNAGRPVRVSVSLDSDDYADLRVIAKDKRVSLAWVLRDTVSDYLDVRSPLFPRKRRGEGA